MWERLTCWSFANVHTNMHSSTGCVSAADITPWNSKKGGEILLRSIQFFLKKKHVLDYKIKQGTCEHYILRALFTVNVHQIQNAPYQSDNFSPKLNCSEEQVVIRTDRATQKLSPQITMPKVTDTDLRGTAEPFQENQMCWSHVHLSLKGIRNEKQHVYTGMGTAHGAHVCVSCILKELNLKMRRLWN